jgi:hypothetical protein
VESILRVVLTKPSLTQSFSYKYLARGITVMPPVKQNTSGGLFKKLGTALAKAHEAHKDEEVKYSNMGDLPPGINNGIAQLVECKFSQYEKGDQAGEYFFYAAGVVVSPTEHKGLRITGLRTSIMEPLCDTPTRSRKTVDEHVGWIYNELRKLGCDTSSLTPDNLEEVAAMLKEAKPFFQFRTWAGQPSAEYPDPRTNHTWNGVCEFTPSEDGTTSGVQDNGDDNEPAPESKPTKTTAAPKATPTTAASKTTATTTKTATKPTAPVKKEPEPEPGPEFNEFQDLDSLGEAAQENGEDGAIDRLTEMALAAGMTQEDIDGAESWLAVVQFIKENPTTPEDSTEGEEEPEPEPEGPKVDDVYKYQPNDPKTKKPAINPKTKKPLIVECTVTRVAERKQTVDLLNLDDGKTVYKAVAWTALIRD